MKLSIIVPLYNVEKYLDECVCSLFDQELRHEYFEVLLIDDGSTDSSLTIAKKWATVHNNVKVFHQENQGQAAARNLGLDNAKGKYVMFVDSDDYLLPQKLADLLQLIDEQELDSVIFNIQAEQQNGTTNILKIPFVEYNHIYSGEEVVKKHFVFGSMCRGIFSRLIFEDNKLRFCSGFTHEDSELCFRLYPLLHTILFIDDEVYYYRYNIQSTDRSRNTEKLRKNIESDAVLVSKLNKSINCDSYSKAIKKRYRVIANSIMTAFFTRVKYSNIWNKEEFDDKIKWLEDIHVYPIKGKTMSWKSHTLSKLLNFKPFLRLYLFGRS